MILLFMHKIYYSSEKLTLYISEIFSKGTNFNRQAVNQSLLKTGYQYFSTLNIESRWFYIADTMLNTKA